MALPIVIQNSSATSLLPSHEARRNPRGPELVVSGTGESLAGAFEQAAVALASLVCDPDRVTSTQRVEIICRSADRELLLVDWLNELVHAMQRDGLVFGRFEVCVERGFLTGTAWGERVDLAWHRPRITPIGANHQGIEVHQTRDGRWTARCAIEV